MKENGEDSKPNWVSGSSSTGDAGLHGGVGELVDVGIVGTGVAVGAVA